MIPLKLLTFRMGSGESGLALGVKLDDVVIDVAAAASRLAPHLTVPTTMTGLLQGGEPALETLRQVVTLAEQDNINGGDAPWLLSESDVEFGPAVPRPGKIICVGLNYKPHAEEIDFPIPETPVLFGKFANAVAAHKQAIPLPADGEQFDYEAELAVIIGRRARNVDENEALDYVFGYCNGNDFSCRDLQFRTGQWLLGKSFDGWCPLGPYLVTAGEVPDPQNLNIRCWVNGEERQNSNTSGMIFSCAQIIAYASRYMTLEPGDVIMTGTPDGVVMGREDTPWLRTGDEIVVEVEGLGTLYNVVGPRS